MGVPLTTGRSLAVDPVYIPLGSFLWLQTDHNKTSLNRLMTAQDTGSAIKGVVRGDFFWGTGKQSGPLEEGAGKNLPYHVPRGTIQMHLGH